MALRWPHRQFRSSLPTDHLREGRSDEDWRDVSFIDRLLSDLKDFGTTTALGPGGRDVEVNTFRGEDVDPPIMLAFSGPEFDEHLAANAADAAAMYPDVDAVTAAYRLFLVHLDTALITKAVPGSRITLDEGHLNVDPQRPSDPPPVLDPNATYSWVSEPPSGRDRPPRD